MWHTYCKLVLVFVSAHQCYQGSPYISSRRPLQEADAQYGVICKNSSPSERSNCLVVQYRASPEETPDSSGPGADVVTAGPAAEKSVVRISKGKGRVHRVSKSTSTAAARLCHKENRNNNSGHALSSAGAGVPAGSSPLLLPSVVTKRFSYQTTRPCSREAATRS